MARKQYSDSSKIWTRRGFYTAAGHCLPPRNKQGDRARHAELEEGRSSLPPCARSHRQRSTTARSLRTYEGKSWSLLSLPLNPSVLTKWHITLAFVCILTARVILHRLGSFCISNSLSSPSNSTVSLSTCSLIFLLKVFLRSCLCLDGTVPYRKTLLMEADLRP